MAASDTHLEVKIFVDTKKSIVLFAEADGDFVEVLFSFLTLPLATILRLIGKTESEPASSSVGCFGSLYRSVKSLAIVREELRDMLLRPRSSTEDMCRRLKINVDDTEPNYFLCPNYSGYEYCCPSYLSIYKNISCPSPSCGNTMTVVKKLKASKYSSKGEVFFSKDLKFIIADDLQVTHIDPETFLSCLNSLGTDAMSMVEERTVKLGLNEVLELLKLTLLSTAPLTDLFLPKKKQHLSPLPKTPSLQKTSLSSNNPRKDRKMDVKVVLNKSNKEFLFVEAGIDFIEFLFSFLVIPLGEMLHLMEGQSGLGCIDGLYNSALSMNSKAVISPKLKNLLVRPKLAPHFVWRSHLFPLESAPVELVIDGLSRRFSEYAFQGYVRFVSEETVFIVRDNLAVTPFSAASVISILNSNKVSISDLEEVTLSVGVAEGVRILRAALNSTCAISKGLLHSDLT